jgi:hypothetical protein
MADGRRPVSLGDVLEFAMTANETTRAVAEEWIAQAQAAAEKAVEAEEESAADAPPPKLRRSPVPSDHQPLSEVSTEAEPEGPLSEAEDRAERERRGNAALIAAYEQDVPKSSP